MGMHNDIQPIVLMTPDPKWCIRGVIEDDIDALRDNLWSDYTITRCRQLIKRITDAKARNRGLGLIVKEQDSDDAPILAYGQIMMWTHCAEISDLIVIPEKQSQGIGTCIIQTLTQHVRTLPKIDCVEIGVASSNPRALSLYRRLGFVDAYSINLKLQETREPVMYLRLFFEDYPPTDD